MQTITLKCFNCGKELACEVTHYPNFAIEVAKIANDAGMYGTIDRKRSRVLVFCDKECADAKRNKNGSFKVK